MKEESHEQTDWSQVIILSLSNYYLDEEELAKKTSIMGIICDIVFTILMQCQKKI